MTLISPIAIFPEHSVHNWRLWGPTKPFSAISMEQQCYHQSAATIVHHVSLSNYTKMFTEITASTQLCFLLQRSPQTANRWWNATAQVYSLTRTVAK
jgi:cation transport ATPase